MGFKEVPKGRGVPFYLTDDGDVYPISFHDKDELEFYGSFIAHSLGTVRVDLGTRVNDGRCKFTAYNVVTKEKV